MKMKHKEDFFNSGMLEKEAAFNKKEIARMKKEATQKEKEIARMKKEAEQKEKEAAKKDYTLERSRIALERLQLNWVKWDITCIALGFTAYRVFRERVDAGRGPIGHYISGREIGIFLITIGFLMLVLATFQHRKNLAKLKLEYANMPYSLSYVLSYIVMGFSTIMLILVLFEG